MTDRYPNDGGSEFYWWNFCTRTWRDWNTATDATEKQAWWEVYAKWAMYAKQRFGWDTTPHRQAIGQHP